MPNGSSLEEAVQCLDAVAAEPQLRLADLDHLLNFVIRLGAHRAARPFPETPAHVRARVACLAPELGDAGIEALGPRVDLAKRLVSRHDAAHMPSCVAVQKGVLTVSIAPDRQARNGADGLIAA